MANKYTSSVGVSLAALLAAVGCVGETADSTGHNEQAFATPTSFCRIGNLCFDVTSTADSGAGTLRQAILDANAANAATIKEIHFRLSAGAPAVIALSNQLPHITQDSVQILGFTQTGAVRPTDTTQAQLQVVLDGSALFGQSGLVIEGDDAKVEGLAIVNFQVDGIQVTGDNSLIQDNFVGVDVDGVIRQAAAPPANAHRLSPQTCSTCCSIASGSRA
jgi:hypothetical protein